MTRKVSKLLTTEEVNHLVDTLKAEKNAVFSIEETTEIITVTYQNEEVFKSLSKGNGTWITRFNEDLFTTTELYIGQLITDAKGCLHEIAEIVEKEGKVTEIITTYEGKIPIEEITIVL